MSVQFIARQEITLQNPADLKGFFSGPDIDNINEKFQQREAARRGAPDQSCTNNLFLGFFFDGTRNNYALDEESRQQTHSNVARLFDAFPGRRIAPGRVIRSSTAWPEESKYPNYLRIYTPGVGTPFEELNDTGERGGLTSDGTRGAAFARWGERRLVWALCQAINAVHLYFKKDTLIKSGEVRQLCDTLALDARRLKAAPVFITFERAAKTKAQLMGLLSRLHRAIEPHMPQAFTGRPPQVDPGVLQNIYVSAFGFSRGATAARAYVNWFLALCELDGILTRQGGYTLGGFPVTFDFLGIFDTVASVGSAAMGPSILGHGHDAWADAEYSLRVPASVKCLHIVSAHEVRRCFPLDAISIKGKLATGHRELIMPGVHSDVGGGYAPRSQGRGVDPMGSDMLSRVALAIMYKEARLQGAPLKLERAGPLPKQRFNVHGDVIKALNDYIAECPIKEGSFTAIMRDQMRMAILWRKAWAGRVGKMASVRRAAQVDINDMIDADQEFVEEMAMFEQWMRPASPAPTIKAFGAVAYCPRADMDVCIEMEASSKSLPGLDPDRLQEWPVMAEFWRHGPVHPAVAGLLENFVHDARAAFKIGGVEASEAEAELKKWVVTYDRWRTARMAHPSGRHATRPLAKEKIAWVEAYKSTGKIPPMTTSGREPFVLGGGYLRWRRVYSGSDVWRLTERQAMPDGVDSQEMAALSAAPLNT